MPFFNKLLNMLGSRATRTSFKKTATCDKGNDGQHFCAGSQLENREQIGQVITKNIARGTDGVFTFFCALKSMLHGIDRSHDLYIQSIRIMIFQVNV